MENEEIHKKREQLRREINQALIDAYEIEGQYWREYHKRLGDITKVNRTGSTSSWARAFGETEAEIIKDKEAKQAKYHEVAMLKQKELVAVNLEFWGAWSRHLDVMKGLSPLPLSSGSTSAALLPDSTHQSGNDETGGASYTSSATGKKQSISDKSIAKGKSLPKLMPKPLPQLLPKLSTTATEAMNAHNQSLTKATQGLKSSAVQPAKNASPLTAPSPVSLVSSPDSSIPASASVRPRRNSRKSTATASPWKPGTPCPQSLTPGNALVAIGSPQEAPEEPLGGAQPAKRHEAAAAEPQHKESFTPINFATPSPHATSKHAAPQSQDDGFNGVTNPKVGEIYKAYYEDSNHKGWWMCTLLPWDAWEREIGINYTFKKANLWDGWPEDQYKVGRERVKPGSRRTKMVIKDWKDDFQDGGSKVRQRIFPMFLFDDEEGAPGNLKFPDSPEKPYTFPKAALRALPAEWVAAENLRLRDFDVGPVGGRETAGRFLDRLRARKDFWEKKGTPKKYKAAGSSGSAVASSPMESSSVVEANSSPVGEAPRDNAFREDTEMADADSLSGATAVDGDTAGQPDVLESAKTAQSSSGKKWRDVVLGDGS